MAPRMIPGFIHQRRLAKPELVAVTCWLANAAVVCRVVPGLMANLGTASSLSVNIAHTLFGVSGGLAWLAVLVLSWNLVATARQKAK